MATYPVPPIVESMIDIIHYPTYDECSRRAMQVTNKTAFRISHENHCKPNCLAELPCLFSP